MTTEPARPEVLAGVPATLAAAGVEFVLHSHPPIRTEADLHLTGLDPQTSVKTLAFELPDGSLVLAGMPGLWRVRYGGIAQALGVPRSQLRPADPARLRAIGMDPGGVSPVSADPSVIVLLDFSLPGSGRIYCGGGTPEITVEVNADDLLRIAKRTVVAPIAQPPTAGE